MISSYPSVHIYTFRKCWNFIWGFFFPVSILKHEINEILHRCFSAPSAIAMITPITQYIHCLGFSAQSTKYLALVPYILSDNFDVFWPCREIAPKLIKFTGCCCYFFLFKIEWWLFACLLPCDCSVHAHSFFTSYHFLPRYLNLLFLHVKFYIPVSCLLIDFPSLLGCGTWNFICIIILISLLYNLLLH